MPAQWDLKTTLLSKIQQAGGFVNCHGHFDKSYYISPGGLAKSMVDMEEKWHMSDHIKRSSPQANIEERITRCLDTMLSQGINLTATFIDAYDAVGHNAIDAALAVKYRYSDQITMLTATQPLGGLVEKNAIDLYEAITAKADIAGGLPSIDRPHDDKHFDTLFSIAKNLDKPLHVHIDQENNPYERDTAKLIRYTNTHGYQGRVVAIHAISLAAQMKPYRQKIYKGLVDAGISVIVCPSADLAMKQLDEYVAPIHNSIPHVPEMIEAGVTVGLGVDNIADYYQPFVDGDMWTEARMLMEACRFYDMEALTSICATNGRNMLLEESQTSLSVERPESIPTF